MEEKLSPEEADKKFKEDVVAFLNLYLQNPVKAKEIYQGSNLIPNITVEDLESGRINGLNSRMRIMFLEEYREKYLALNFMMCFHPDPSQAVKDDLDRLQTLVTFVARYPMIKNLGALYKAPGLTPEEVESMAEEELARGKEESAANQEIDHLIDQEFGPKKASSTFEGWQGDIFASMSGTASLE